MTKKLLLLLLPLFSFSAIHAEIDWNLSDDGTLTISGKGDGHMPDYGYYEYDSDLGRDVLTVDLPWKMVVNKIKKIVIKDGVTNIGKYAFLECSNLVSITIPNSVTSIGNEAFYCCSALTSVTIPNSVTSIGGGGFCGCSGLTSVTIPNSVTSIGDYAFKDCSSLTSITIPNSVTSIGYEAFWGCISLVSITIPNSVTSIGEGAFFDCTGLTSVTIPNSVTSIGEGAFFDCSSLTSITFERSTPPEFGKKVFDGLKKSIPVYVPFGSIEAYKNALEGQGFSSPNIKPLPLSLSGTYTQKSQVEDVDVSYTRNFSNTKWQALYLPFSLKYEDWKDDFEIAYINAIRQKDNNDDGKIDETILEFIKMNSGSTAPNTPYIIRAKEKGEKTLSAKNTTVYPAENNSVDCTTTTTRFTFTGIYKAITASYTFTTKQYYVLDGEKFSRASVVNYPKAYQWYMEIKSRNSSYATYNPAKEITISVLGEEETTGISQMQMENRQSSVYDINGRKVDENSLKPGMYVKNGRKVIIR